MSRSTLYQTLTFHSLFSCDPMHPFPILQFVLYICLKDAFNNHIVNLSLVFCLILTTLQDSMNMIAFFTWKMKMTRTRTQSLNLEPMLKEIIKMDEYVHGWNSSIGWMFPNGIDEIWRLENSRGRTCQNCIFKKQCFTTFIFSKSL